jgi:hypothetical protein
MRRFVFVRRVPAVRVQNISQKGVGAGKFG